MKTDEFIDALSRTEGAVPRKSHPWLFAILIGLAGGVLLLLAFIGPRPDLGTALWPTLAKAAFSGAFAAAGLALTARLAKPGRPVRMRAMVLGGLVLVSAVAAIIALLGASPGQRLEAWTGGGMPWCLVLIPLLAIPAAGALGYVMRNLAPTNLTAAGAAVGAASGGFGAMVYAMRCPVDHVAFVATWYALAIALCALIGAVVGARLLRW